MTYTYTDLQQLWIQAGGDPKWADSMAAVGMLESGGNPTAHNPSGATGLWQIEVPGSSSGLSTQQLYDPLTNAKQAVNLLGDGSGIQNWGHGQGWDSGDAVGNYIQNNGSKPLTTDQLNAAGFKQYTGGGSSTGASGSSSGSGGSSGSGDTATNLPGVGGFLQQLDKALNPTGPGWKQTLTSLGTANLGSALEMLIVRIGLAGAFTLVVYFGIKQLTGGSGGTNVIQITQGAVRTGQAGERARTARRAQDLRERQQEEGAPVRRYERTSTVTYRNPASEAREARLASKVAGKSATGAAANFVKDAL